MTLDQWVLPTLLVLPLVGALLIGLVGVADTGEDERKRRLARSIAFWILILEFLVSLTLWTGLPGMISAFDSTNTGWQFTFSAPWIPAWGITFSLGIDGVALVMILLTTFIMPLAILGSWTAIKDKAPTYYSLMLILTTGMLGVFVA